jgi:hypothetical protein
VKYKEQRRDKIMDEKDYQKLLDYIDVSISQYEKEQTLIEGRLESLYSVRGLIVNQKNGLLR